MCPETHQKEEIRIYICEKFPYKWKFYKTLIKNINAVDTILFEKDKPEIFVKGVLNDVESLSKISTCKKIEKFDQQS